MEKLFRFCFTIALILMMQGRLIASDLIFRMHDHSSFTIVFNQSIPVYGCPYYQQLNLSPGNYAIEVYNSCLTAATPCAIPLYRGTVTIPDHVQVMAFLDAYNRLQTGGIIPLEGLTLGNVIGSTSAYRNYFTNPWSNLNDSLGYEKALKTIESISPNVKYKLAFLKRCIYFYGISAQRLAEIMKSFSFDSERLDLATYGYLFTKDRENYNVVYEALIFEGSKRQLDNHLYYLSSQIRW
jgi:hypothetical protein